MFEALGGGAIGSLVTALAFGFYVRPYLTRKAKNLATREDIGRITDEVERVKSAHAALIEELRAKHQLRMAALDRRLQAHQDAYTLWHKLTTNVHKEELGSIVAECKDWWTHNCLFLEPEARDAFLSAYIAAHAHSEFLLSARQQRTPEAVEAVEKNWRIITAAGEPIVKAVQLPGLSVPEKEQLKDLERSVIKKAGH